MCFFGTDTFGRRLLISAAEGGGPLTERSRCRSQSVTFLKTFTNSICIQGINPYFLNRVYNQELRGPHVAACTLAASSHPRGIFKISSPHRLVQEEKQQEGENTIPPPHPKTDDCYTKLQEQKDKEAALTPNTPSPGPN